MIERDEAALQALQKMYHDEDYAMDLVKQAADRLLRKRARYMCVP